MFVASAGEGDGKPEGIVTVASNAFRMFALIIVIIALLIAGRDMPQRSGLLRSPLGRAPRPRSLLWPTVGGTAVGVIGRASCRERVFRTV